MSGSGLEMVHTAVSYWLGALSDPVLMVSREEMLQLTAGGAIIWDVRSEEAYRRTHVAGALSLGSVDWLLAENSGGNLIPGNVIEDRLCRAGIREGCTVIVYADDRAVDAFVALRALRSIGIRDAQVCLGDGAAPRAGAAQAARAKLSQESSPASSKGSRVPVASVAAKSRPSAGGTFDRHPGARQEPAQARRQSALHQPA